MARATFMIECGSSRPTKWTSTSSSSRVSIELRKVSVKWPKCKPDYNKLFKLLNTRTRPRSKRYLVPLMSVASRIGLRPSTYPRRWRRTSSRPVAIAPILRSKKCGHKSFAALTREPRNSNNNLTRSKRSISGKVKSCQRFGSRLRRVTRRLQGCTRPMSEVSRSRP